MKSNITVYELCKITQLREQQHKDLQYIQAAQDAIVGNTKETFKGKNGKVNKSIEASSVANKTIVDKKRIDSREDGALIEKKSRYQTPKPFLLTFKINNSNVDNYLVDSGASSNVMSYLVCKKLNVEPQVFKTNIIQSDRSNVKVMGEIKDVLIHLDSTLRLIK